jgi:hypothetical protein
MRSIPVVTFLIMASFACPAANADSVTLTYSGTGAGGSSASLFAIMDVVPAPGGPAFGSNMFVVTTLTGTLNGQSIILVPYSLVLPGESFPVCLSCSTVLGSVGGTYSVDYNYGLNFYTADGSQWLLREDDSGAVWPPDFLVQAGRGVGYQGIGTIVPTAEPNTLLLILCAGFAIPFIRMKSVHCAGYLSSEDK